MARAYDGEFASEQQNDGEGTKLNQDEKSYDLQDNNRKRPKNGDVDESKEWENRNNNNNNNNNNMMDGKNSNGFIELISNHKWHILNTIVASISIGINIYNWYYYINECNKCSKCNKCDEMEDRINNLSNDIKNTNSIPKGSLVLWQPYDIIPNGWKPITQKNNSDHLIMSSSADSSYYLWTKEPKVSFDSRKKVEAKGLWLIQKE